jgi:cytochrome c
MLVAAAGAVRAEDVENGRQIAQRQCSVCHALAKGGGQKMGPGLWGIVGRRSASVAGYRYDENLRKANLVWTPQNLAMHLAAPSTMIHGAKTKYEGLRDPQQLDDVIAFLETLK